MKKSRSYVLGVRVSLFAHAQRVFVKAQEHGFFSSRFDKLRLSSDSGSCSEGRESSSGADQTEELSAIQGHEKSPMRLLIVTDNYCQLIGSTRKFTRKFSSLEYPLRIFCLVKEKGDVAKVLRRTISASISPP